jgi:hypothetical protein
VSHDPGDTADRLHAGSYGSFLIHVWGVPL